MVATVDEIPCLILIKEALNDIAHITSIVSNSKLISRGFHILKIVNES